LDALARDSIVRVHGSRFMNYHSGSGVYGWGAMWGSLKGPVCDTGSIQKYHTIFLSKVNILTSEAIDKAGGKKRGPKKT